MGVTHHGSSLRCSRAPLLGRRQRRRGDTVAPHVRHAAQNPQYGRVHRDARLQRHLLCWPDQQIRHWDSVAPLPHQDHARRASLQHLGHHILPARRFRRVPVLRAASKGQCTVQTQAWDLVCSHLPFQLPVDRRVCAGHCRGRLDLFCLLFGMLGCLLKLYLNCGLWTTPRQGWGDENFAAHIVHMLLFDAQFSLYAGWVTVACIVNATVALTTTGWDGAPFSDSAWSVIMQAVALVVNLAIVVTRRDFVYPSVLCWATYWISQANTDDTIVYTGSLVVSISAGVAAVVTALFVLVKWIRYLSRSVNMTSDAAATGCDYGSDNVRNDQERVCDA